ncbi:amino acid adenylation domain-containing protein [Kitasatospora sp. NPDC059827]|uniref:amino acid adenylation domain-containing protein n=1 Tax=Kitasatospora sp. NPDC059827 TaxID=3346964 RepID=UPI003653C232
MAGPPTGAGHDRAHPGLPSGLRLPAQGRACHGVIARLPGTPGTPGSDGTPGPDDTRRRLEQAARRLPELGSPRLWETRVPTTRDDPRAAARARRELLRPVHDERSPLRAVRLTYADGTADLVLVALRRLVPRALLEQVAGALLTGAAVEPPSADAPSAPSTPWAATAPAAPTAPADWGLGDRHRGGTVSARPLAVPGPGAGRGPGTARLLVEALALTVARYSGAETVAIGNLDVTRGRAETARLSVRQIDEEQCVADRLAEADAEAEAEPDSAPGSGPRPELPAVGVVHAEAWDGCTYLPCLTPLFPITVHLLERPDGAVEASCWFDEGVLAPEVADTFCASVERLAARFAADSGATVPATLPPLTPEETARVLRRGGAGRAPGPGADRRIDDCFEEAARRRPDAVALTDEHGELTYGQLDERADRVAAGLHAFGVAPGSKVGVCLDRDASVVVAMLGILKAGCAYVPMDVRYPADRLRYVVEDARLPLVVADAESFPAVADVRVVGLDELSARGLPGGGGDRRQGTPADDAYVIYTSGSTGRPKGVVVPHRNVTALLAATGPDFALRHDDVWTLFHSTAFDFSVWETWGCLLSGGRLVVVPHWTARDPEEFHRLLVEQRVTVLNQTPSAFAQLVRADRAAKAELSVRLLVLGGEPLDVALLAPWFAGHSPTRCRVVNMYGITETTVHVTAQTITPAELVAGSRSVGRALPGWSVSVRDARGRVLPPGAAGEIHVGGAGLAAGYLGRPELTAQRFVTDEATGERLYRSGDQGRLRPDGSLDHLGRLDQQVKIRGHRIEPGEIRAVLAADPAVSEAVVVATAAAPGDPASSRIDAYVVLAGEAHEAGEAGEAGEADTARILDNARRILPDYMVPATLTRIPAVPLTTNGKPDLDRLPPPAAAGRADGSPDSTPPGPAGTDDLAAEVLGIWSEHLRAEVSMADNFFLLGGNSLLVLRVLRSLQERGLPRIAPRDFYRNSTADTFIRLVAARRDAPGTDRP